MVPKYSGYAQTVAAMVIALTITGTTATNAQTTIGKRNSAAVSVDLSVLDQLGGTTNVPQLLRPSVRSLLMPNARQPTAHDSLRWCNRSCSRHPLRPAPLN